MKRFALFVFSLLPIASLVAGERPETRPGVPRGCDPSVMSAAYWAIWNESTIARLDAMIEKNRKVNAAFAADLPVGTEVAVEQLTHAFRFGAHAYRIGRQPTEEINRRYEDNFARLFNQTTIMFYWRNFELSPGDPHFHTRPGDLESAFTSGERDRMDARSRYLASPSASTDQFLEFAKNRGMIVHGHPLVWGSEAWMIPFWLYEQYCPEEEKDFLRLPRKDPRTHTRLYAEDDWLKAYHARIKELFATCSEEEIAARCPVFLANMKRLYARRVADILDYCGDRVDSWDVVNESSKDWADACGGSCETAKPCVKSEYGIMPPNYTLETFRQAAAHASSKVRLSINDYNMSGTTYVDQIDDLLSHGARIDMVGSQFHIFEDDAFRTVVAGGTYKGLTEPDAIERLFAKLGRSGRPVSISEITIPALGNTAESRQQQAIVAVNLYRAWFAQPNCCGITWWHTIDGANRSGGNENGTGGIMDADGRPKPSYEALYDLIHREWKTKGKVKVEGQGQQRMVSFRGFPGNYRLSWKCAVCGGHHEKLVRVAGEGALAFADRLACPDALKQRPVRSCLVDGKAVALPAGEKVLDLAKHFSLSLTAGEAGTRWAEVACTLVAPKAGTYRLARVNDYFGELVVNGKDCGTMDGPWDSLYPEEFDVQLEAGENRVVLRTRAGTGGCWRVGFFLPNGSPLESR